MQIEALLQQTEFLIQLMTNQQRNTEKEVRLSSRQSDTDSEHPIPVFFW